MGSSESSFLVPIKEAESASCPQCRCLVAGPLDEYCDFEKLWTELSTGLRTDFAKEPNLKHGEVEDVSDNVFRVNKLYDKDKMGIDHDIAVRIDYYLDKSKGEILEEHRDQVLKRLIGVRTTTILQNPLRMEMLWQSVRLEERRSGPLVAAGAASVLKGVLKRDVTVAPNMESKVIPGVQSAISEPLDEDTSFEELWSGIVSQLKSQSHNPYVKNPRVGEITERGGPMWFDVTVDLDADKLQSDKASQGDNPKEALLRMELHKESRAFAVLTTRTHGSCRLINDVFYSIIHDAPHPLATESWMHTADPPGLSPVLEPALTGYVKNVLDRLGVAC